MKWRISIGHERYHKDKQRPSSSAGKLVPTPGTDPGHACLQASTQMDSPLGDFYGYMMED